MHVGSHAGWHDAVLQQRLVFAFRKVGHLATAGSRMWRVVQPSCWHCFLMLFRMPFPRCVLNSSQDYILCSMRHMQPPKHASEYTAHCAHVPADLAARANGHPVLRLAWTSPATYVLTTSLGHRLKSNQIKGQGHAS